MGEIREFKFRGQRVDNGEWVFGDLTKYSEEMSYITVDLVKGEVYQVYTETVGQATGKNNIYQGDIVQDDVNEQIGVVVWDSEEAGYRVLSENTSYPLDEWEGANIIGNVHDDPELYQNY